MNNKLANIQLNKIMYITKKLDLIIIDLEHISKSFFKIFKKQL